MESTIHIPLVGLISIGLGALFAGIGIYFIQLGYARILSATSHNKSASETSAAEKGPAK